MPHHEAKPVTILDRSRTIRTDGQKRVQLIKFKINNGSVLGISSIPFGNEVQYIDIAI